MRSFALVSAIFAAATVAQTSVVEVYLPIADEDASLSASVVDVKDAHTTYLIGCQDCGEEKSVTYTVVDHPSTVEFGSTAAET